MNRDFHREALPRPVGPGQQVEWEFACPAPPVPGVHHLKFDLVVEGVSWFEAGGSDVVVRRLETEGR